MVSIIKLYVYEYISHVTYVCSYNSILYIVRYNIYIKIGTISA